MRKFSELLKMSKSSRYFIGVSAPGSDDSHMTIKFLGNLNSDEVEYWKNKMDQAGAEINKFRLESKGIGQLGFKGPAVIADYIEGNDRINRVFKHFENNEAIPHVTRQRFKGPDTKNIAFPLLESSTVDKIHLYEVHGYADYRPVYSVDLKRRTPLQFIKDLF